MLTILYIDQFHLGNQRCLSIYHTSLEGQLFCFLEKRKKTKYDIVVMVQGDEPMIYPEMINRAVEPMLKDPTIKCVNLTKQITFSFSYTF